MHREDKGAHLTGDTIEKDGQWWFVGALDDDFSTIDEIASCKVQLIAPFCGHHKASIDVAFSRLAGLPVPNMDIGEANVLTRPHAAAPTRVAGSIQGQCRWQQQR